MLNPSAPNCTTCNYKNPCRIPCSCKCSLMDQVVTWLKWRTWLLVSCLTMDFNATLSLQIFAESKSANWSVKAILNTFKEDMEVLMLWHNKTIAMYPDLPEIIDLIPKASELDIGKINDGSTMTDTSNKVHKWCRLLSAAIKEAALKRGHTARQATLPRGSF